MTGEDVETGDGAAQGGRPARLARGAIAWVAAAFPLPPSPQRPTPRQAGLAAVAFVAAVAVSLLRQWRAPALDTIWAEDGRIFLMEALRTPTFEALVAPYNGYIQLFPRAVGEVVALLPPPWAADAFALTAAVVTAAAALLVFAASAGHVRSVVLRGGLALAVLLAPAEGSVMLNNVANSQWYLLIATCWLLLWRPRWRVWRAVSAVVAGLTALTAPMSVAVVPLAVARLAAVRERGDRVVPATFLAAAALQLLRIVTLPTPTEGAPTAVQLTQLTIQRVLAPTLAGTEAATSLWMEFGWVALEALAAVLVLALAVGLVRSDRSGRAVALLLVAVALAVYVPSVYARGDVGTMLWPPGGYHARGGRYVFMPMLLLVSALVVVLDHRRPARSARRRATVDVVAVVLVAVVWLPGALWPSARSQAARWDTTVAAGRWTCDRTGVPNVLLPLTPYGWNADVDCSWLARGRPPPPE